MLSNELNYKKYLVIFVDLLGSKNRKDFNINYKINEIFHETFQLNQKNDQEHTVYYRKCYSFSDCAYIFYGYKDGIEEERKNDGKLFTVALCNCEDIFLRFIKEKILFRGGITYGDAYLDSNRSMFFGEAVTNAYILESEKAIHPRIIIDDYVAKEVLKNIDDVKKKMELSNPELILPYYACGINPIIPATGDGIIEEDIDGQYIYNYLHFPEYNMPSEHFSDSKQYLEDIVEFCDEQISLQSNFRIIDKYNYLKMFAKQKIDNLLSM